MTTRPTSDRVKEALFNIISEKIAGSEVLDIFAGTGSLGIEALSRGAKRAVFIDKSPECCGVIKENTAHTKLTDRAEVYAAGFEYAVERLRRTGRKFDIVFLDPPYSKNFIQEALKIMTNNDIMVDNGIIAAEHRVSDKLPESIGGFEATGTRRYGDTAITFYVKSRNDN
jgi:16S rRNA (guanine966-N2)-methyltransferase